MPFVEIYLPATLSFIEKKDISQSIHQSLINVFKIPENDFFQVINEVRTENLIYPESYFNIPHEGPIVYIYITCGGGRTVAMKKALYALIAEKIGMSTSVSSNNVIIILNESAAENWSFGQGGAPLLDN